MFRAELRFILILILGILALGENLFGLTWRGAPLDKTKSFLVTECGISTRLTRLRHQIFYDSSDFHLEWELGWMRNTSPHWAFGATAYFGADDNGSCLAVKPRARRWLSPTLALDLSAGPTLLTFGDLGDRAPGLVAGIGLMKSDLIGLTVTYELTPYRFIVMSPNDDPFTASGTRHELYAGMRLGSYPGAAAGIAIPVGVVIWILSVVDD